ncbi:S-formylglutathione hydrolase FrmB [Nocardia tenerifensis]|uniref:S-formylglutathione hydrolase FrmB n=1 Tax=Nocardia tenerifensis TaxID=228006 RepID=A0A318K9P9_9NOCA|nr:S-formylglutathione hydrolase FrmB [Nocardia tenerifensis]
MVTEERSGERIVDLTVRSTALGGTAPVRLVTPTGWDARTPGRTWPVLYLLPGGDGDHASWTADSDVEELPQLRDVLVVIPSMPMFGFYTNWHNAGREDPRQVETFHLDEVIPLLERDYGAGQRRVVAGLSQGGYGALKYTAQHPGMFRAAASYSGWLHPLRRADVVLAAARVVGADGAALWGDPLRDRAVWEANDVYHLSDKLIGVPIYLSAGTGAPGEFDLPDLPREELFPELDRLADEFPGDVVDVVEAVMDESTRAVAERLRRLGGEPITNFTAGTHNPPYWEREFHRSLPMLLDALGTTR